MVKITTQFHLLYPNKHDGYQGNWHGNPQCGKKDWSNQCHRRPYNLSESCSWSNKYIPLQKLSMIVEQQFNRTYCIAIRVPKGSIEDCEIYDQADAYEYARLTGCDDKDDYFLVGGCDHKVGQEDTESRSEELEQWVRDRFQQAGTVDYAWSGQIAEPVDLISYIGLNPTMKYTYIITGDSGDSGDGLTHGVYAENIIADTIQGLDNPWSKIYSPSGMINLIKSAISMIGHDLQVNSQYKRLVQSDIGDIASLPEGEGGVLNNAKEEPLAVYKDDVGKVHKFSALCPHLKGVVCWNKTEKTWDCPVHASRFSKDGHVLNGPSKMGLTPHNEAAEQSQKDI